MGKLMRSHEALEIYNSLLILHEEVEIALAALKTGKSAKIDYIPSNFVQACKETMTAVLTKICNKTWRTEEWQHHGLSC